MRSMHLRPRVQNNFCRAHLLTLFNLNPGWIRGHIYWKVWYGISYPFGATVEVWEWISDLWEFVIFVEIAPTYYRSRYTLQWRHNGRDGVSNHRPHDCLLNRLFRRRSTKIWKLHVTGICAGNSPVTGEFPAQMTSHAENVFIWWRHHGNQWSLVVTFRSMLILSEDYLGDDVSFSFRIMRKLYTSHWLARRRIYRATVLLISLLSACLAKQTKNPVILWLCWEMITPYFGAINNDWFDKTFVYVQRHMWMKYWFQHPIFCCMAWFYQIQPFLWSPADQKYQQLLTYFAMVYVTRSTLGVNCDGASNYLW